VAAVWAFYIVLVMGGRWWASVVTVAAWVLLLTGCWRRIVSAAGRCLLGLCGALRRSPGLCLGCRGCPASQGCDGVVWRLVRWVGPYVAGVLPGGAGGLLAGAGGWAWVRGRGGSRASVGLVRAIKKAGALCLGSPLFDGGITKMSLCCPPMVY